MDAFTVVKKERDDQIARMRAKDAFTTKMMRDAQAKAIHAALTVPLIRSLRDIVVGYTIDPWLEDFVGECMGECASKRRIIAGSTALWAVVIIRRMKDGKAMLMRITRAAGYHGRPVLVDIGVGIDEVWEFLCGGDISGLRDVISARSGDDDVEHRCAELRDSLRQCMVRIVSGAAG